MKSTYKKCRHLFENFTTDSHHNRRAEIIEVGLMGRTYKYKLCTPKFVTGAVPTLFINLVEYLSDKTVKRKPPKLRIASTKKNIV
ncbi:hypothetical protein FWK35_00004026 [Aphis craccivora]|uniref:Uncharacterized protein n=1 Tax=Aphis craccivora TaxID=307492 RepID=A0A6G0YWG1_APHCR|nr:hypothetical protein FWK35_00004026 [Aphis craccivora]